MNKLKILYATIIVLLLSNLLLAGAFFIRGRFHHGEGPKKIIIEKLHFDKNQIATYEKLITAHRAAIKANREKLATQKNELYSTLVVENNSQKDSLLSEINKTQLAIENIHYNHFLDIKKICKPSQQAYFNDLTEEIASLFAPKNHPEK